MLYITLLQSLSSFPFSDASTSTVTLRLLAVSSAQYRHAQLIYNRDDNCCAAALGVVAVTDCYAGRF